eukprot:10946716-Alexandrium_andersonii.AAC.1
MAAYGVSCVACALPPSATVPNPFAVGPHVHATDPAPCAIDPDPERGFRCQTFEVRGLRGEPGTVGSSGWAPAPDRITATEPCHRPEIWSTPQ